MSEFFFFECRMLRTVMARSSWTMCYVLGLVFYVADEISFFAFEIVSFSSSTGITHYISEKAYKN